MVVSIETESKADPFAQRPVRWNWFEYWRHKDLWSDEILLTPQEAHIRVKDVYYTYIILLPA